MIHLFFEDSLSENFYPLTLTKPAFDLLFGSKTLLEEKLTQLKPTDYQLMVRDHLKETTRARYTRRKVNPAAAEDETLFVHALLRLEDKGVRELAQRAEEFVAYSGPRLALARLRRKEANDLLELLSQAKSDRAAIRRLGAPIHRLPESSLLRYPWTLVEENRQALLNQLEPLVRQPHGTPPDGVKLLGPQERLLCESTAIVEPQVTTDTRAGPVYVGEQSEVHSPSRLEGPSYIGHRTIVRSALIRGGTTLGDTTRIGGEVEESIIANFTNKAHEGFLGHSYVGEWVNIGASTTTSDLKNTYGTVRMAIAGEQIDTGAVKMGCLIADHAKISIGTMIYAGKKIGVAAHVHGFVVDDVPSFTIYARTLGAKPVELDLRSALTTQRRMMARRKVVQTAADRRLLQAVFELTQEERYRFGVRKARFLL